jgi:hypothetical protein
MVFIRRLVLDADTGVRYVEDEKGRRAQIALAGGALHPDP